MSGSCFYSFLHSGIFVPSVMENLTDFVSNLSLQPREADTKPHSLVLQLSKYAEGKWWLRWNSLSAITFYLGSLTLMSWVPWRLLKSCVCVFFILYPVFIIVCRGSIGLLQASLCCLLFILFSTSSNFIFPFMNILLLCFTLHKSKLLPLWFAPNLLSYN